MQFNTQLAAATALGIFGGGAWSAATVYTRDEDVAPHAAAAAPLKLGVTSLLAGSALGVAGGLAALSGATGAGISSTAVGFTKAGVLGAALGVGALVGAGSIVLEETLRGR